MGVPLCVVNSFKENGTKIRWWNAKGKRKIVGDRVRNKEILQGFIFLFHLVDSFNHLCVFLHFRFVATWIQCGCFSSSAPLSTVCLLCSIFFRHSCFSQKSWSVESQSQMEWRKDMSCFIELFPPLRVLVFFFRSPCVLHNQVVRASECRNCPMCECFVLWQVTHHPLSD